MIKGLRRILGEGVLLAGGNAHKVDFFISSFAAPVVFRSCFRGLFPRMRKLSESIKSLFYLGKYSPCVR